MTEHAEDPVGHASTKIVQYVSLATMAAEALAQRSQQRAAEAAAADERATRALRAQQTGARNAARLHWQPVLDPRRAGHTSLADAGVAWASSQAWREVDPEAALASDRALDRMRELRPDVMERFDRLTANGPDQVDQVEAMRRVAPFLDRPAAREHGAGVRPELLTTDTDRGLQAAADSAARAAGDERTQFVDQTAVLDDPRTPHVDERLDAIAQAEPHLDEAASLSTRAAALHSTAHRSANPALAASDRTPPQLAAEAYPEALTGAVLAAGQAKTKTPPGVASAAARRAELAATGRAARASGGRGR